MGGTGVGYSGGGSWDLNPSLLGSIRETVLSMSLDSEVSQHSDGSGESWTSAFRISDVRFAVPLPYQMVAGVSVNKRFDMGLDISGVPGSVDTIEYERSFTSRGGIYSTSILLAREIGDYGSLGLSFNLLAGSVVEEWLTEFPDSELRSTRDSLRYDFFGGSSSLGALAKIGKAFSFGFSLTTPAGIREGLSPQSPDWAEPKKCTFPWVYAGGCSYRLGDRFVVASDLAFYPWEGFRLDGKEAERYLNTHRLALGFQLLPRRDEFAPLWRKFPLRIGYYNSPWYFKAKEGGRIGEQFLTLGLSLPVSDGRIHMSLELGERKGGDLRERVLRGAVTLSGWERW